MAEQWLGEPPELSNIGVPILKVEAVIPEESLGDVLSYLTSRRGRIVSVRQHRRGKAVSALVPGVTDITYRSDLRSLVRGRFRCKITLSHYEPGGEDNPDDAAGVPSPIKLVWPPTLAHAIALEPPPPSPELGDRPGIPH